MAYGNLKAEMGRNDITIEAIANELHIHRNSASSRVNGITSFSIEEAQAVRDKFFPKLQMEYLFQRDSDGMNKLSDDFAT